MKEVEDCSCESSNVSEGGSDMFANRRGEQIYFDSRSELATCVLLEKYVSNWKPVLGETVQVPISKVCLCDFRINGVFFEYHPIVVARELGQAFADDLEKSLARVSPKEAYSARNKVRDELAKDYWRRRKAMIEIMYGHGESLILATEPEQVWSKVIQRFAKGAVSKEKFMELFRSARCVSPIDDHSKKRFRLL